MNLGLLAPLAAALGALVLGPILAHLAQQRPSQQQVYGAMLLLRRLVKRLEKRRRLKDRWLLLLRALAVLALVFAVSRPELRWTETDRGYGGNGAVFLIVDDSMSMGQIVGDSSLLNRARQQARALLDSLPAGTPVALLTLGGEARALTAAPTTEHAQVMALLDALEPTYGRTDLHGGLLLTRGLLAGEPGEVFVFTDEAGPNVVSGALGELKALTDRGVIVVPKVVSADPPRNIAIASALYGEGLEGGAVTVRVQNFGPEDVEVPTTVGLPDGSEINAFVEVPAFGEAEERFTVPQTVPGGVAWARVRDDALLLDNTRYFHLPRVGASRVMVVDGDPGVTPVRSEVYFLERALAPWGGLRGGVLPEVVSPSGLTRLDRAVHQVVFLANVADPGPYSATLLDFVRAGGGVVIGAGDNLTAERYNGALRELLPAPLDKPRDLIDLAEAGGVPLILPDTTLELFKPFARSGRGGFGHMSTRRIMALKPFQDSATDGVRTLLRYEGGVPAMVERRIGRGRVLLWTSTFDVGWGNTALQASFIPFVQRLVGYLGGESGGGAARAEGVVGEPLLVNLPTSGIEPEVFDPDGDAVPAEILRGDTWQARFTPDRPGAYTVGVAGEPPMAYAAVNTPAEESDVRVSARLGEAQNELNPGLFTRREELGRAVAGLGLLLVLAQAALAGRGSA